MIFSFDVPVTPIQTTPIVLTSASPQGREAIDHPAVECRAVGNSEDFNGSAYNQFVIGGSIFSSLGYKFDQSTGKFNVPAAVRSSFKTYIVDAPKHGEIFQTEQEKLNSLYSYRADAGYIGPDSFVIGGEALARNGRTLVKFKFKYNVSVVEKITNENEPSTCEGMKFSYFLPRYSAESQSAQVNHRTLIALS